MSTSEQEALDAYLKRFQEGDERVSFLEAVVRDARETFDAGNALWLAAIGYLITLEQVGHTVKPAGAPTEDRRGSRAAFVLAIRDFGDEAVDDEGAHALYDMRCALAHQYGLNNRPNNPKNEPRIFAYARSGPLLRLPPTPWDGTVAGARDLPMTTVVNMDALADFVERVVERVRAEHEAGGVELIDGLSADEVVAMLSFRLEPVGE